jgi:hypothetical protein
MLQSAGAEDGGGLLVATADALEDGLSDRGDVFAAIAQGRKQEADCGEAEGEVGDEMALVRKLAERSVR